MPARRHAGKLGRDGGRLERALRPFQAQHGDPVTIRLWPGRIRTTIFCAKERLPAQWDYFGWIRKGVLLVTFRSVPPIEDLSKVVTACSPLTKSAVFLGDLDPVDLATYVALESLATAGGGRLRLLYGGIDDWWLEQEKANRRSGSPSPMMKMSASEARLWRALTNAHPSIERTIGSASMRLLNDGLKLEVEGACNLEWHGQAMCKLVFHRALRLASNAQR